MAMVARLSIALLAAAIAGLAAHSASAQTFTGSQQRVSEMGPDGSTMFRGTDSDVAFNSATGQYLVVWRGDDDTPPLADDEDEIFGRFVGPGGAPAGPQFRVSDMGPDGDTGFGASTPRVAYNPAANEFLVVWAGSEAADEEEIYGQRLSGGGGALGTNDFRISDMGPDGNTQFRARSPAIAHNPATNRYLVVWTGDDDTPPLVDNEREIFGELLDAAGAPVGANDFRISDMGPDTNTLFGAALPDVAANPASGEFLVVWQGDDDIPPLVAGEFEIFGQRLDINANQAGANDFRISHAGPDGDTNYAASSPAVAFNPATGEFLVVWNGDSDFPLDDDEIEIFGQRLDAVGNGVGADFRISQMGPDGFSGFSALHPDLGVNPAANEYLVVWDGDDDTGLLVQDEIEVFGQRLTGAGNEIGADDFRISQMGPDGDPAFGTDEPAVAFGQDEFLVSWDADDGAPLVDNEFEVFARGVAGVEPEPEPEPEPEDTEVSVLIKGKRLVLSRKRKTSARLRCPAQEASPPCAGTLVLKTRRKVSVAKKRKLTLAKKPYAIGAGQTKKVKLKLSNKAARTVRRNKAARKVLAKTRVSDAAGNRARVTKKMRMVPVRKKRR